MAQQTPSRRESAVNNPQVLAAIIGGIVTVIVAVVGVVPAIINGQKATPVIVTATPPPATTLALVLPSIMPSATPVMPTYTPEILHSAAVQLTPIVYASPVTDAAPGVISQQPTPIFPTSTATPAVPPTQAAAANVLLLYDGASFSMLNQDRRKLSFEGVFFRSSAGEWEARRWGPSLYNSLPPGMCLRLRDAGVGSRNPPAPCVNQIYGLQEVGTSALFWIKTDRFDVVQNGQTIATCIVADRECSIYIP